MKSASRIVFVACTLLFMPAAGTFAGNTGFFPRSAIESWHGAHLTVQRLDFLRRKDIFRNLVINWASSHPRQLLELQSAIRSNRPLFDALRARNVEIGNVVAAQRAFNGGLVLYLR